MQNQTPDQTQERVMSDCGMPFTARLMGRLMPMAGLCLIVSVGALGCRTVEDPGDYSRSRPPADRLDDSDRGLQSYDVVAAADQMATSLASEPFINQSPERKLIVFDRSENLTATVSQNLDIFLRQLRAELFQQAKDRVQIIENRAKLRDLQSRELEQPYDSEREFGGVGAPRVEPGPAGIQPDYSLSLEVRDLPNRGTNYYQFDFTLTDLRTREIVWTDIYDVRVAR